MKDYIIISLIAIAITFVYFYNPIVERMTNKDLLDTLKTFGDTSETSSKGKTQSQDISDSKDPIYGPKITPVPVKPQPKPGRHPGGNNDHGTTYPDIYGPDDTGLIPGKSHHSRHPTPHTNDGGKTSSVVPDDKKSSYEFNPDLRNAFPTASKEPSPYVPDYSKIQK